jgi:replicative DNA helicase
MSELQKNGTNPEVNWERALLSVVLADPPSALIMTRECKPIQCQNRLVRMCYRTALRHPEMNFPDIVKHLWESSQISDIKDDRWIVDSRDYSPCILQAHEIARQVSRLNPMYRTGMPKRLGELMRDALKEIQDQMDNPDTHRTIRTPLVGLNDLMGGFHRGELTVIAARPGLGKTSLALQFAVHAARREARTVLFYSLEIAGVDLALWALSSYALVDLKKLRTRHPDSEDFTKMARMMSGLENLQFRVSDPQSITPEKLCASIEEMHEEGECEVAFIDYLQLMKMGGGRDRHVAVGEAVRQLKTLCVKLRIPIVLLAQLNREAERAPEGAQMHHLRESGDIEAHADNVILIDRAEGENLRKVYLAKQRRGPTGHFEASWRPQMRRFADTTERNSDD